MTFGHGNEALGFLRPFLMSGTPTIVAARAEVSAKESVKFLSRFYANLGRMPKGRAFSEAQRYRLRNGAWPIDILVWRMIGSMN